jgi:hypothetical protein
MNKPNEFFKEIFGSTIKQIEYPFHPTDEILRDYFFGKLQAQQTFSTERLDQFRRGKLDVWSRTEVSAHVMTCRRCSMFINDLIVQSSTKPKRSWQRVLSSLLSIEPLRRSIRPVPGFARVIMVTQFMLILALAGAMYLRLQISEPSLATVESTAPKDTKMPQVQQDKMPLPNTVLTKDTAKGAMQSPDSLATTEEPAAKQEESDGVAMSATPSTSASLKSSAADSTQPAIAELTLSLNSADPNKQIYAAQQLGVLRNPSSVPPLVEAFSATSNPQFQRVIITALREIWEETQNEYLQTAESLIAFKKTAENKPSDPDLHKGLFSDFSLRISFGQDETGYPLHFKVRFHQDVTLREINALSRQVRGLFILDENTPDEAILKLPEKGEEELKQILQVLSQNPKVKFIERQK